MIENKKVEELLERVCRNPRLGAELALGTGCERIAYKLDDEYVVKINKGLIYNLTGEEGHDLAKDVDLYNYFRKLWDYSDEYQTEAECDILNSLKTTEAYELFNPILETGVFQGGVYTISPIVKTSSELGFRNLDDLCRHMNQSFNYEILQDICKEYQLDYEDMTSNPGNYGVNKEGRVVIIDFGLGSLGEY